MYDRVYHTPLAPFSMLDISILEYKCRSQNGRRWKHLARELCEDVSFGNGTLSWLSSNRAWHTAPEGRDIHRRTRYARAHSGIKPGRFDHARVYSTRVCTRVLPEYLPYKKIPLERPALREYIPQEFVSNAQDSLRTLPNVHYEHG